MKERILNVLIYCLYHSFCDCWSGFYLFCSVSSEYWLVLDFNGLRILIVELGKCRVACLPMVLVVFFYIYVLIFLNYINLYMIHRTG